MEEVTFKYGGDTHKYEMRRGGSWNWMADATSARGRPYLNVTILDVAEGEGRWDFYERHRRQRLALAPTYAHYESVSAVSSGHYIYGEYILQPQAGDCRYNVVEHGHPSWNAPDDYAFIISAGICEEDLPVYGQQREAILGSFNEIE